MIRNPGGHTWHVAASDVVLNELRELCYDVESFEEFATSPARDWRARRRLRQLEELLQPSCVFTFAGPSYVRFRAAHLVGCTDGWVTHPTLQAYRSLAFPHEWLSAALISRYKAHWFRIADAWVVQTETARRGLCRRAGMPPARIAVIPNSCVVTFRQRRGEVSFPGQNAAVRILCIAAAYKHKRLTLVPEVAKQIALRAPQLNVQFVLTLPQNSDIFRKLRHLARRLCIESSLINAGPVSVAGAPALYESCHICFQPTVLETFSASYLEAMAFGLPIVTSDLSFARDVCKDAALYFRANDAAAAADCLIRLLQDPGIPSRLVAAGQTVLARLPTPAQQFTAYLALLYGLRHASHATP